MILLICGILRNGTHELIYKTEILTDTEKKLIATKYQRGEAGGGGGGWINYEFESNIYTLLYTKQGPTVWHMQLHSKSYNNL